MSELLTGFSPERLEQFIQVAVFIMAALATAGLISVFAPRLRKRNLLAERLGQAVAVPSGSIGGSPKSAWHRWLKPVGEVILPRKVSELASIRSRLGFAGYRRQNAVVVFYGLKAFLALTVAFLYFGLNFAYSVPVENYLWVIPLILLVGYFLPNLILHGRIKRRQEKVFSTLPEAMDLLVVCVESGLGIDAALRRVGEEIGEVSPVLGHEFGVLSLELQTGVPRSQALQNLSDRNGEPSLRSMVRVLSQAERFGTGIAQSLRIHSESITTKRIQMVEELAAKSSVKLVFPLVLCILPALWIVLVGPALIRLFAALQGGGN